MLELPVEQNGENQTGAQLKQWLWVSSPPRRREAGAGRAEALRAAGLRAGRLPWTRSRGASSCLGWGADQALQLVPVEHFGFPELISRLKHFHSIPIIFPFLFAWADLEAGTQLPYCQAQCGSHGALVNLYK